MTGSKEIDKKYFKHSGYPGGEKETPLKDMREKYPERIITNAVRGMLPKNKLGRKLLKHLKVYKGGDHPHAAQKLTSLDV